MLYNRALMMPVIFTLFILNFGSNVYTWRNTTKPAVLTTKNGRVKIIAPLMFYPYRPYMPAIPALVNTYHINGIPKHVKILYTEKKKICSGCQIYELPAARPISAGFLFKYKTPKAQTTNFDIYPQNVVQLSGYRKTGNGYEAYVVIYPYQYNNVKKTLFEIHNIKFEISYDENSALSIPTVWDTPLYLIITDQNFVQGFSELIKWKVQKGYRVKTRTMQWVSSHYTGRDDAERLRNYLKIMYEDSGLKYVLLGGDVDFVPARIAFAMKSDAGYMPDEDSLRADLYFEDLDGTWDSNNNGIFGEVSDSVDLYPDIYAGRAPVRSAEEASVFSSKIVNYEKNPTSDYLDRALFFAMILWSDPYTNSAESKDYIDSIFMPANYSVEKLYEANGNENHNTVLNAINNGQGILNHNGHGWYSGMWVNGAPNWEYISRGDADTLKNGNRIGVLYSIGCWVGAFDYDAISEHLIRNPQGGVVAFIGNSRYGWGSPGNPLFGYSDRFDRMFYRKLFADSIYKIGRTLANAKSAFIPFSRSANVYRWHQYQLNLLGDPEMNIRTEESRNLNVECSSFFDNGGILSAYVSDNNGPIGEASCTLTYGDSLIYSGKTDNTGSISIHINDITMDSVLLTCFKENHNVFQKWIYNNSDTAVLAITGYKIVDNLSDGNGYAEPGEYIELDIHIKNISTTPVMGLTASLLSYNGFNPDSTGFSYTDTILPENILTLKITGIVNDTIVPNSSISLKIDMNGERNTLNIPVKLPEIKFETYTSRQTAIVPGDTQYVVMYIKNQGQGTANCLRILLGTPSSHLYIVTPGPFSFDSLPAAHTDSFSLIFYTDSSINLPSVVPVLMSAQSQEIQQQVETLYISLTGTSFSENFEQPISGQWYIQGNWHRTNRKSFDGNYSMYAGIDSFYENNEHDTLITPYFYTGEQTTLSFAAYYSVTNYGSDGLYIYYDNHGTWQVLDFLGSGGALTSKSFEIAWNEFEYPLKGLGIGDSTRIKFVFSSDSSDTAEGAYIDDLGIISSLITSDNTEHMPYINRAHFSIFPVPASRELHILLEHFTGESVIELFDTQGRLIDLIRDKNASSPTKCIVYNTKNLSKGIYFLVLKNKGNTYFKKVVIVK